jgi:hypothetical protein
MPYDQRSLKEITEKYRDIGRIHDQLMLRLMSLLSRLKNDKAKEYLTQGAGRRLNIVTRCVENIFGIFPIGQTAQLTREELADVVINLHAFFVNLSGLFDNLGWVFVFENELLGEPTEGKLGRNEVGLFNRKTQSRLPDALRTYLQSERLQNWYSVYSKNYRDALAHRIPLYVPPFVLSGADQEKYLELEAQLQALDRTVHDNFAIYDDILERQKQLGQASPFFVHSVGEEDHPVFLHAQVIADYATIEEIVNNFGEHFETKAL